MNLSEEDLKTITNSLIKASNATETEWLIIEKVVLESLSKGSNVQGIWEHLHSKVEDSIKRMKNVE